jgi:hypothetical protein
LRLLRVERSIVEDGNLWLELPSPQQSAAQPSTKKNRAPQITLSTLYNPKKPNENFLELTPQGWKFAVTTLNVKIDDANIRCSAKLQTRTY